MKKSKRERKKTKIEIEKGRVKMYTVKYKKEDGTRRREGGGGGGRDYENSK
jgi:hypothetical protein